MAVGPRHAHGVYVIELDPAVLGERLPPELYECLNPMPYEAARTMEQDLADELQEKGYAVWQG